MKISGMNPETGKVYEAEANHITTEFIEEMSSFEMADNLIKRMIDQLDISADSKSLLYDFSELIIKAGQYVIQIGRKIIDYVCSLFKTFPTVTFGAIFGAIMGLLVSSIPVIGWVLGPIVTPILIGLGMIGGAILDIPNVNLNRQINKIVSHLEPLKA